MHLLGASSPLIPACDRPLVTGLPGPHHAEGLWVSGLQPQGLAYGPLRFSAGLGPRGWVSEVEGDEMSLSDGRLCPPFSSNFHEDVSVLMYMTKVRRPRGKGCSCSMCGLCGP